MPASSNFLALGACPCPNESVKYRDCAIILSSANCCNFGAGSTPGDKIKINGERLFESSRIVFNCKIGGSTNLIQYYV